MDNPNPDYLNIDDDFIKYSMLNIEKLKEKIQNIQQNDDNQNTKLADYINFNEIFDDIKKINEEDVLPNFLDYDIIKKVNNILDRPYSTIIYADPEKKAILAHMGTLISFFSYYSAILRYLYKISNNEYLRDLIKDVLAKNDGYLNMALELFKIETSIHVIKDNQIIGQLHQFIQNQNYGNQFQNK